MDKPKVTEGTPNTQTAEPATPATVTETVDRKSNAFTSLQAEAARHKAEATELRTKFEAIEKARLEAEEQKKLEEGKHLELIEQLKKEKADLEIKTYHSSVKEKLRAAGINSQLALNGAVVTAPMGADDAALIAWIADLKTANPSDFAAPLQVVHQTSVGAPAATSGDVSAEQIKIWETSPDRLERLKAVEARKAYREKHGTYPD